jgi:hypothetical protein
MGRFRRNRVVWAIPAKMGIRPKRVSIWGSLDARLGLAVEDMGVHRQS